MSEEILAGLTDDFIARIGTIQPVYNQWQLIHAEDEYSSEVWFYDIGEHWLEASGSARNGGYEWQLTKWNNPHQGVIVRSTDFNIPLFPTIEAAKLNGKQFLDFWLTAGSPNKIR